MKLVKYMQIFLIFQLEKYPYIRKKIMKGSILIFSKILTEGGWSWTLGG